MTSQDPFALARSRDSFSLEEAARIARDVPLSRRYPRRLQDWTQELRDEAERVAEALHMLKEDAEALGVEVKHVPAVREVVENFVTGKPIAREKTPARTEYGNVQCDALRTWCESKGVHAAFFHAGTKDAPAKVGAAAVAEMNANRALAVMAWLIAKQGGKYKNGNKPNVSQISNLVTEAAQEVFGEDVTGFSQFRKRLATALKESPLP